MASLKLITIFAAICVIGSYGTPVRFLRFADGGYEYEYETADGLRVMQMANGEKQVRGEYEYDIDGEKVLLRYIANKKDGFMPNQDDLKRIQESVERVGLKYPMQNMKNNMNNMNVGMKNQNLLKESIVKNKDGSYQFEYKTDDSYRQESSDAMGNIQGSFSYVNEMGVHDLSYMSGPEIGFVPLSGSLKMPNGLSDEINDCLRANWKTIQSKSGSNPCARYGSMKINRPNLPPTTIRQTPQPQAKTVVIKLDEGTLTQFLPVEGATKAGHMFVAN